MVVGVKAPLAEGSQVKVFAPIAVKVLGPALHTRVLEAVVVIVGLGFTSTIAPDCEVQLNELSPITLYAIDAVGVSTIDWVLNVPEVAVQV